jgi:hypothetical protein
MVVATSSSIGANFRKISSNSGLRLRSFRVSVSRRDKTPTLSVLAQNVPGYVQPLEYRTQLLFD